MKLWQKSVLYPSSMFYWLLHLESAFSSARSLYFCTTNYEAKNLFNPSSLSFIVSSSVVLNPQLMADTCPTFSLPRSHLGKWEIALLNWPHSLPVGSRQVWESVDNFLTRPCEKLQSSSSKWTRLSVSIRSELPNWSNFSLVPFLVRSFTHFYLRRSTQVNGS